MMEICIGSKIIQIDEAKTQQWHEQIEERKRENYEDRVTTGFIPKERCTHCGGTSFFYYRKSDVLGNMQIKAMCENCGHVEHARQEKNRNKRSGKHQDEWRCRAIKRIGGKCQICGSTENINVHHIIPVCVAPQFVDNDGNAAVVCKRCHDMIHRCDDWSKAYDHHL